MRRRVVITGLGTISSAGANAEEARASFRAGSCCLSAIGDPGLAHLKARYAGLVNRFAPAESGLPPELAVTDKHVWMAIVAGREALAAAGVAAPKWGRRLGLIFATCSGPMLLIEAHYERLLRGDGRLTSEELFAKRYYSGARILAHALGIQGLSTTVVTACTAGTAAIALAADLIHAGLLDAALAGGSDAFSTSTLAGFDGLKATSEARCAPFSKPFGLNLGEAAAFVFLEAQESAARRNANVRAELLGSGMSNDAYHCSAPEPSGRGLASAMQRALVDARISPAQISYVNAHGTGTEANDKAETRALRRVFEARAEQVPVSSTKSMIGHCLGAAGVIEAAASILCAEAGVLPSTANFTVPREGCPLDYVPEAGRPWPAPRTFLSNNLAFGGHNASLVMAVPGDGAAVVERETEVALEEICITGCGLVSPLGLGLPEVRPVGPVGPVGEAGRFVYESAVQQFSRRLDLRHMDRSSRWATIAAALALRESGYPETSAALAELGFYLGLSAGPSWAESEFLTSFLSHNRQVSQVMSFPYIVPCSVAGNVCRTLRLTGHNLTLSCGPGAGLLGLGPAVAAIRAGHCQALLSGAVDELSERILEDQVATGLARPGAPPPGEGAAVLMLETISHANARGAKPLAWVRALAFSTETTHRHQPDSSTDSLQHTVTEALARADLSPGEVDIVCAQVAEPRWKQLAHQLSPDWPERLLTLAPDTGILEGSQPLFDLAAAFSHSLQPAKPPRWILAISSSPEGTNAAALFEKFTPAGIGPVASGTRTPGGDRG